MLQLELAGGAGVLPAHTLSLTHRHAEKQRPQRPVDLSVYRVNPGARGTHRPSTRLPKGGRGQGVGAGLLGRGERGRRAGDRGGGGGAHGVWGERGVCVCVRGRGVEAPPCARKERLEETEALFGTHHTGSRFRVRALLPASSRPRSPPPPHHCRVHNSTSACATLPLLCHPQCAPPPPSALGALRPSALASLLPGPRPRQALPVAPPPPPSNWLRWRLL